VRHGEHVAKILRRVSGEDVGTVFGETASAERDRVIAAFKSGELKYLVNVNVLTTGFDAPNIDCVAMVRPTLSPGLYYQMTGRGFRLHPGKENCLVLDFGGNVLRHGPVDAIRVQAVNHSGNGDAPAKQCPECRSLIAAGYAVCPDCGYEFPERERRNHEAKASTVGILSGQVTTKVHPVSDVYYSVHQKRGAHDDAPKTLRVEYRIGFRAYQSEWVCFEHTGWARHKAESWWRRRSYAPVPNTAAEAETLANEGALCETRSITVRSIVGEEFPRIIGYELGAKPPWRDPGADDDAGDMAYATADQEEPPF
jgi:DNA repair protein RadD